MTDGDLSGLSPLKAYKAPALPTLHNKDNPARLNKLPARWQKNAAVAACAGVLGAALLASCASTALLVRPVIDDWPHYGGSGAMPMYVVQLTEQESLGVIRAQLEAAGLNLSADVPDVRADFWGVSAQQNIGLDLFDAEKNVAIVHVGDEVSNWRRSEFAQLAAQAFAQQSNMPVGVFYSPSGFVDAYDWNETTPFDETEKQEARMNIEASLAEQVQAFIEFLQAEGVLP